MLFRASCRLLTCKYICEYFIPIYNIARITHKSFSFTSKVLKQDGVIKHTGYKNNNLLNTTTNEDRVAAKVKPVGLLYPSKRTTKTSQIFEAIVVSSPNVEGFSKAIEEFKKRDLKRLKMIDFIPTAMAYMDVFGVTKNVNVYNNLLDLFPRGRYHYKNVFDTLWTRYRPQIDTAILLLTKMEENGVRPNVNTYDIVEAVFGSDSIPMHKVKRIVFWFDKFDEMYPHPLPQELPTDKTELFTLAIQRMFGNEAPVIKYKNSTDASLFVGTYSSNIIEQLEKCDKNRPLFVEGPFPVWLRKIPLVYYVLQVNVTVDSGDSIIAVSFIDNDGSEEELKNWLNELQKNFPRLEQFKVIFNISNKQ